MTGQTVEYSVLDIDLSAAAGQVNITLNNIARGGWRLVAVDPNNANDWRPTRYIFERSVKHCA